MSLPIDIAEARELLGDAAIGVSDSAIASLVENLYIVAQITVREEIRNQKSRHILPRIQPGADGRHVA